MAIRRRNRPGGRLNERSNQKSKRSKVVMGARPDFRREQGRQDSNLQPGFGVRPPWLSADDERWQAYLTDDESAELAFYCLKCAEREFGEDV